MNPVEIVCRLNDLLAIDPESVNVVMRQYTNCNFELAKMAKINCDKAGLRWFGSLQLISAMFGVKIVTHNDSTGRIIRFAYEVDSMDDVSELTGKGGK